MFPFTILFFCSIGKLSKLEELNLENNKLITLPERYVASFRVIQVLPHTFFISASYMHKLIFQWILSIVFIS